MWGWGVVELFILFLYTVQRKKGIFFPVFPKLPVTQCIRFVAEQGPSDPISSFQNG